MGRLAAIDAMYAEGDKRPTLAELIRGAAAAADYPFDRPDIGERLREIATELEA